MTGRTTRLSFAEVIGGLFHQDGILEQRMEVGAARCWCDGFDVALHHDGALEPHHVQAYIDLGAVPAAQRLKIFRSLLLGQLQWGPPSRTVVGLENSSGHVVLVVRVEFDRALDGERLAEQLRRSIRETLTSSLTTPAPEPRMSRRRNGWRRP